MSFGWRRRHVSSGFSGNFSEPGATVSLRKMCRDHFAPIAARGPPTHEPKMESGFGPSQPGRGPRAIE